MSAPKLDPIPGKGASWLEWAKWLVALAALLLSLFGAVNSEAAKQEAHDAKALAVSVVVQ